MRLEGRLVGLIAPHAGLRYSGPVAAHAYACLRGRSRVVAVLVGPSHRVAFDGVALYDRGAWETPLGPARIDEATAALLLGDGGVVAADERPHRQEHSLEMQLPFLQHLVPDLRIVPLLMGNQSRSQVDALAAVLARVAASRGRAADRVQRPQPLPPGAGREPARCRRGGRGVRPAAWRG